MRMILTHPYQGNYGGMLQAWALQKAITGLHRAAKVVDYKPRKGRMSFSGRIVHALRNVLYVLGCISKNTPIPQYLGKARANKFKPLTQMCSYPGTFDNSTSQREALQWVVGSDQVWRANYGRILKTAPFYFLDFVSEKARRQSISYAASFGTDEWEGTPEETERCRELLQQFKAVSVREHSGVKICREVFGVEAVQMPDPTLLVEEGGYQHIIDSEKTYQRKEPYIAAYILDESPEPLGALQAVSEMLDLPVQHLMPHARAKHRRDRFPLSVPQWLRYMKESSFVVTDSFHGCVFAIIFNKPFVCLGNEGRGSARFDTLFQTFHLESRLATTPEQAVVIAQEPIDWDAVNTIHEAERARGLAFLRENLK